MSEEQSSNNYTRNNESEINIESIISAPFIAISKANTMLLSGQARFILDYCFVKKNRTSDYSDFDSEAVYEPIMINLLMRKSVVKLIDDTENSGQQKEIIESNEAIIAVPLLSIIPINSIAIDKIKVDFNMEITSITSYNNQSNNVIERKAQLNGKISADKGSSGKDTFESKNSSSRTLSVQIEAGSLPLPLGILNILDLYSKNIYPTKIE